MINKDGGDTFWILWGGHSSYEGDIELMGGPPTRENPDFTLTDALVTIQTICQGQVKERDE